MQQPFSSWRLDHEEWVLAKVKVPRKLMKSFARFLPWSNQMAAFSPAAFKVLGACSDAPFALFPFFLPLASDTRLRTLNLELWTRSEAPVIILLSGVGPRSIPGTLHTSAEAYLGSIRGEQEAKRFGDW